MSASDELLKFWAKKKGDFVYPLLYHMLDVAMVTREMWEKLLQQGTRSYWSEQIGIDQNQAGKLVSFWAGLHDLGKASPAFQEQWQDNKHGIITAYVLKEQFNLDKQIAVTVGGHHGVFPRADDLTSWDIKKQSGNKSDTEIRHALLAKLAQLCGVDSYRMPQLPQTQAFFMFIAGLTSVADWIASNEMLFPLDNQKPEAEQQLKDSKKQATQALERLGWTMWQPPEKPGEFNNLFPFIKDIRPLQSEIVDIAQRIRCAPGLVIIEAPMGEGKTEAAMYLADSWAASIEQKGCYFALPTQATSNQMFGRVREFLARRYPEQTVNFLLLHGHAALSAEFQVVRQNSERLFELGKIYGDHGYDKVLPNVVAAEWFTYRKRGLLAPFGLGTIDQALLAVLQTRHVFVRLFGLAGKTIIIDEVHAYDAYMTTLLERLLEWLAALGSSVILLSATLPKARRNNLLEAYQRGLNTKTGQGLINAGYPRISWVTADGSDARHIGTSPQSARTLTLEKVKGDLPMTQNGEFELGIRLREALSRGGCAAIICNTVNLAQQMYVALKKYFPGTADDGYPELDLLHARYRWGDRSEREKRTLVRFGKPSSTMKFDDGTEKPVKRPDHAILVATQIIEQSLDLDFDLMVTEMAPIDLLLQRSGRLQRHERPDRKCFKGNPTLWIFRPCEPADGTPDFGGGTEAVYERHILLRSWLELKERTSIKIPDDMEALIEAVYGDKRDCPADLPEHLKRDWKESLEKLEEQLANEKEEAQERRIKKPAYDGELWRMTYDPREEDDPSFHPDHRALTRLTGLNISVICLGGDEKQPRLDGELIDTSSCPNFMTIKRLLNRSVTVSQYGKYGIVNSIIENGKPVPQAWRENPLLRHHYLLCFDGNGRCHVGNYELILDEELGLMIEKNKA